MNYFPMVALVAVSVSLSAGEFQYRHGEIVVPPARADEGMLEKFSLAKASAYLEQGATAWAGSKDCVSCHTTGSYLLYRPSLTSHLGKPSGKMREFFLQELRDLKSTKRERFRSGTRTAQAVYIAAGLAEWDAHVTGSLSRETDEALQFVFDLQQPNGAWQSLDCWPPFESSAYQEATVVAMAVASAPGWLKSPSGNKVQDRVARMKDYLRKAKLPHDYARVLKLWTEIRLGDLEAGGDREAIINMIWKHQRSDGGWSIRSFGKPEQWGSGNRAEKLRKEGPDSDSESDGHMTGLALLVLKEAGISNADKRVKRAVRWLRGNQRESGRWWTRSLNTDKDHFITYSGTLYPLMALMKCGELEPLDP